MRLGNGTNLSEQDLGKPRGCRNLTLGAGSGGPPGRSRLASGSSSAPPHVPGAFKAGAAEAAARGPICSGAARGAGDALQLVRGPGSARGAAVCWGLLLSTLKHGSGRGRGGTEGRGG